MSTCAIGSLIKLMPSLVEICKESLTVGKKFKKTVDMIQYSLKFKKSHFLQKSICVFLFFLNLISLRHLFAFLVANNCLPADFSTTVL